MANELIIKKGKSFDGKIGESFEVVKGNKTFTDLRTEEKRIIDMRNKGDLHNMVRDIIEAGYTYGITITWGEDIFFNRKSNEMIIAAMERNLSELCFRMDTHWFNNHSKISGIKRNKWLANWENENTFGHAIWGVAAQLDGNRHLHGYFKMAKWRDVKDIEYVKRIEEHMNYLWRAVMHQKGDVKFSVGIDAKGVVGTTDGFYGYLNLSKNGGNILHNLDKLIITKADKRVRNRR